jgi:hypothetical protein
MAKHLLAYIFRLRSTSFNLAATTIDDAMAFDVENDECMGWWDSELAIVMRRHTN